MFVYERLPCRLPKHGLLHGALAATHSALLAASHGRDRGNRGRVRDSRHLRVLVVATQKPVLVLALVLLVATLVALVLALILLVATLVALVKTLVLLVVGHID